MDPARRSAFDFDPDPGELRSLFLDRLCYVLAAEIVIAPGLPDGDPRRTLIAQAMRSTFADCVGVGAEDEASDIVARSRENTELRRL